MPETAGPPEPVFVPDGDAYVPTGHARGPWDPGAQHGGAPAALLARELQRTEPGADMLVARITYEFLGAVPLEPLVPAARVVRPGRRFQLLEGELTCGDRVVVRARAARLRRAEIEVPAVAAAPGPSAPGPEASARSGFFGDGATEAFARTAMEIRFAAGTDYGIGPALTWFRFARPLVAGETPSPLQLVAAAADFGNGVSRVLEFDRHLFVNTDLTIHIHREPAGEWVLLDARTSVDPGGAGLAASTLSDESGAFGLAAQTLFVEPR